MISLAYFYHNAAFFNQQIVPNVLKDGVIFSDDDESNSKGTPTKKSRII